MIRCATLLLVLPAVTLAYYRNLLDNTIHPGACFDRINPENGRNDCMLKEHHCHDKRWLGIMKEQCAKTCSFCVDIPDHEVTDPQTFPEPEAEEGAPRRKSKKKDNYWRRMSSLKKQTNSLYVLLKVAENLL